MKIRGWGASDVGRKRSHNEDSFLCNDQLSLYAVADGMGGHLGGERASRMAVELIEGAVRSAVAEGAGAPAAGAAKAESPGGALLKRAILDADRAIHDSATRDPSVTGMGTTLTALLFVGQRVHLSHVGDSRAYLCRDGNARQLTDDHSWIQEQVRAGLLSLQQAKESRFRNIITRSVGFEPVVQPDMQELTIQAGDCYLLCSDGLSNYLSLDEIGHILMTQFYRDAPHALIALANDRGGDDNITCVCISASND